jgi:hypothetical protein
VVSSPLTAMVAALVQGSRAIAAKLLAESGHPGAGCRVASPPAAPSCSLLAQARSAQASALWRDVLAGPAKGVSA